MEAGESRCDEHSTTSLHVAAQQSGWCVLAAATGDTGVWVELAPFAQAPPRYMTSAVTAVLTKADFMAPSFTLKLTVSTAGTAAVTVPQATTFIAPGAKLEFKKTGTAGAITITPTASNTVNGTTSHAACDAQNDLAEYNLTGVGTTADWALGPSVIA